jgi:hypothetical protein
MALTKVTSSVYQANSEMLGGIRTNSALGGKFSSLAIGTAGSATELSAGFASHSGTVIQALNKVMSRVDEAANPGGSDFMVQFNNSEVFGGLPILQIEGPTAANTTHKVQFQATGGIALANPSAPGTDTFTVSAAGAISGAAGELLSLEAGTNVTAGGAVQGGSLVSTSTISGGAFTGLSLATNAGVTAGGAVQGGSLVSTSTISGGAFTGLSLATNGGVVAGGSVQGAGLVSTSTISGGAMTGLSLNVNGGVVAGGSVQGAGLISTAAISGGAITGLSLNVNAGVTAGGAVQGATVEGTTSVTSPAIVGTTSLSGATANVGVLNIAGTDAAGSVQQYKIHVSGGILLASEN